MKLLVVTPYFYPKVGGVEDHTYNLYKRLRKYSGYEISVLTAKYDAGLRTHENIHGMSVYRLPYQLMISNTPVSITWIRRCRELISTIQPDIILAHAPVPFLSDIVILTTRDIPVILKYHCGSMKKEHGTVQNICIDLYEKYILRAVINKTAYVLCTSDYVRNVFLKEFASKSVTITPGVDTDIFKPLSGASDNARSVLYVGRVDRTSRWKGIQVLIDSMPAVVKSVPAATLSIVGEGDDLSHYKKYVDESGLRNYVHFYGKLTGRNLVTRYQKSTMLVLPSITDTEGFGMVLIEAMACKKPVIGSRVGGIPSVIKEGINGLLVPPGSTVALAGSIVRVLKNPRLAQKMGTAGYEMVKRKYTWDIQVEKTKKIIDKIYRRYHS